MRASRTLIDGFAHSPRAGQRRIERVDGARHGARALTEARRVAPGRDDVSTRDVTATLERAREAVLVERRAVTRRRLDHAERFESVRGRRATARSRRGVASATSRRGPRGAHPRALGSPRRDRRRARRPRTIATPSTACARPVRDAATFDRARRPRRGGRRARDCRARCVTPRAARRPARGRAGAARRDD